MSRSLTLATLALLLLSACQGEAPPPPKSEPPWVLTAQVRANGATELELTGTVRARHETPVAFQVGGRIATRHVDAGQRVVHGAALFRLDPRDLEQAVQAAEAEHAAALSALRLAQADAARNRTLQAQAFVSRQALDRAELVVREAQARLDAARARLQQARHARGYAALTAAADGVAMSVSGEPGQVVAAGQPVAVIALDGTREIEVFFPDSVTPPRTGEALLQDGSPRALTLRETAGAADPDSRTWRSRYRVDHDATADALALGGVVRVRFATAADDGGLAVPLGALDERAEGARVWQVVNGAVQPVPVEVVALDAETAHIRAKLAPGSRVVALGTHLLKSGMAVRERQQ
jgi:RND family efflux transporter MFP subunit